MAKQNKRTIKLMYITDGNVMSKVDDGVNREGGDATGRASLRSLLRKTVEVDGVQLPLCALAEEPEAFSKDDRFDIELLKDRAGKWIVPDQQWLAIREKNIAKNAARYAEKQQLAKSKAAEKVLEAIQKIAPEDKPKAKPKAEQKAPVK